MERSEKTTQKHVREAMRALGAGDKEIPYSLVYEMLGIDNEADQAIVRTRISDMTRHGEVKRVRAGVFIYDFKRQPRQKETLETVWRFVRAAKPGWTIQECSLMTRASYSYALRYVNWLEEEGYVEKAGFGKHKTTLYRNTVKAQMSPETPYMPAREDGDRLNDPFAKERMAVATLTRLMLCANPYAVKTAREISEACRVLLARFDKTFTQVENGGETHVE